MRSDATQTMVEDVVRRVESNPGWRAHLSQGVDRTVIGVVGSVSQPSRAAVQPELFLGLPGVDRVVPISRPYKLASREFRPEDSVFPLDGFQIGGKDVVIIAGPCAVESRSQFLEAAQAVCEAGAHALRGGVFKPRTSPYTFQGMGEAGFELLAEAREKTGMPIVAEVMAVEQLQCMLPYVDVLQIGARNMQNYSLLQAVGDSSHPVLLKRGISATIEELLMAAEYILSRGNSKVILCERGIRTFETATRNTTDINAIPVLKSHTHLPVIVDPSHSTGHWEYIAPVARAAIAAGADGLIVEVHPNPLEALSDGAQSLTPEHFAGLVVQARAIAEAVGRRVAPPRKLPAAAAEVQHGE
jgi:3-deoxy-7-phosphoheptulonate synthase